jgi:hypothetical protein
MVLRGIDRRIGLTERLANAFDDRRHPSYVTHPVKALFAQRTFQVACACEDANDANSLRSDPVFKLGLERKPLDADADLASAPTFSRLENAATPQDIYRLAQAFVGQFVASYAKPPAVVVLGLDHSEDEVHGRQEQIFYNAHYGSHCYLPLFIFEGISGKLVTAALRTGKRPAGAENAAIVKRVLRRLRAARPVTRIVLRGDGHFANPELMQLALDTPHTDFLFGVAGNSVLSPLAKPFRQEARQLHETRCAFARLNHQQEPDATRTYHGLEYAAKTWPKAFRVALKAEVMALGENPRFVVTSLGLAHPRKPLPRPVSRARPGRELDQDGQERSGQRPRLRPPLPRQSPAPVLLLRGVCAPPCATHRSAGPYRTGEGPASHGHPETVQNRRARRPVQGSRQAAPAQPLPGQTPAGQNLRHALPDARAGLEHRLTPFLFATAAAVA